MLELTHKLPVSANIFFGGKSNKNIIFSILTWRQVEFTTAVIIIFCMNKKNRKYLLNDTYSVENIFVVVW